MGMQDRDYYREWWKEKQGHVEGPSFRSPVPDGEDDGGAYLRSAARKESSWRPVLTLLAVRANPAFERDAYRRPSILRYDRF
jgi:hypothetical protein